MIKKFDVLIKFNKITNYNYDINKIDIKTSIFSVIIVIFEKILIITYNKIKMKVL